MTPFIFGVSVAVLAVLLIATWKAPRLTSTLAWALTATMLVIAALAMNVPGELTNKLIGFALFFPLLWVGLQFWCYWDPSKWRVALGHISLCVVSGIIVASSTPLG